MSCSHSYSCNCRQVCSGSGNSRSCSTVCDTCYEHSNDWDWDVFTTVGTKTIDRVDRRGTKEPPRWTAVEIGEPAAAMQRYTNYVKAAPNSLFNTQLAEEEATTKAALIPPYPRVHDYYRINRVIEVGGAKAPKGWNELLNLELRKLGAAKQVNVVMVFIKGQGREYVQTLERAWLGGKKNDVTIVVGTSEGDTIDWVEVFTFGKSSGNGMLVVQLRDDLQALGSVDKFEEGVAIITRNIKQNFSRKEMADYEYLKAEGGPSTKQIGLLVFVLIIVLAVSTYFLWKNDVFGVSTRYRHRSNFRFRFR